MNELTKRILENARKLLADVGWVQNQAVASKRLEDGSTVVVGYCAMGALDRASSQLLSERGEELPEHDYGQGEVGHVNNCARCAELEKVWQATGEASDRLRRAIGFLDVMDWNDAYHRQKEQVIAAFDKALEPQS